MEAGRMTWVQRRRLTRWRQQEGVMTSTQQLRLAQWRRQDEKERFAVTFGEQPAPIWCLVANVVAERRVGPGGTERRHGTKHFAPGAKVYCFPPLWDSYHKVRGVDKVNVVGRHRRSHRYITLVTRTEWLTQWRAQLVYSPHVIREIMRGTQHLRWEHRWNGTAAAKDRAQQLAAWMRS